MIRMIRSLFEWRANAQAAVAMGRMLLRHRNLTLALTRRDITDRHADQMLGLVWVIGHPLLILAVYTVVFAVVFNLRIPAADHGGSRDYLVFLLAGLIPWLCVQETLGRGSQAISGNASLVRQVVMPVEVLPAKTALAALVPQVAFTGVLLAWLALARRDLASTIVFLPGLMLVQTFGLLGLSFAVAAVAVFFRDLRDLIQLFNTVGIYLTPVFYAPHTMPNAVWWVLAVNPFSHLVWCYQDLIFYGDFVHGWSWAITLLWCTVAGIWGFRAFRRLKPGFGHAL